jgi:MoaA/NifB/PqqE/SkfB family radical SAM enzyme
VVKAVYNFVLHASRCTNDCVFCGSKDFGDLEKNITYEFNKIDRILKSGETIESIEISGNDPAEYDKLPEIIEKIAGITKAERIELATHGKTLADMQLAAKFVASGVNAFKIPLYGHTDTVHDAVTRAPGSFDQTMKGIANIQELKQELGVHALLTAQNQDHAYDIILFLRKHSNNYYISIPCYPRNAPLVYEFIPDFKRLRKTLTDAIIALKAKGIFPLLCNIPYCMLDIHYDRFMTLSIPKKGYEHFRSKSSGQNITIRKKEVIPEYRMMIKGRECRRCIYFKQCSGFLKTMVDVGYFSFRPVKALEDR